MLKLQSKVGFLLIELLLALALLVSLISTLGYWQWQIIQQGRAWEQYLQALVVADNSLIRLLAGDLPRQNQHWQHGDFTVATQVQSLPSIGSKAFQTIQLRVSWQERFTQQPRTLTLIGGHYG
ncbi:MAG TPA: hypothetical protein VJJ83_05130 [Candidatus Babeliales bacterium]|nr:hypothetical protein [Candidatus Babeliales bacterium]